MDHYIVQKGCDHAYLSDRCKGQLTNLVRRAEASDEVILTRHGQPAAKLVPIKRKHTPEERHAAIKALQEAVAANGPCETNAAHSQDFLYDEDGLPK